MLESSKDVLNYTLAASAAVLTFFIVWLLWYFIKIFRDIERVVDKTTSVVEKFSSVLDLAKDQIKNAAAVIPLMIKAGEKLTEFIMNIREKRAARDADTKTKNNKKKSEL